MEGNSVTFADLMAAVDNGSIDIAGFQRLFEVPSAQWGADVCESLVRDPPIEIGPLIFWNPDPPERPPTGRYRTGSLAEFWLIDGQKRLTALLAAQGRTPPWWDEDAWRRRVGSNLEVGLVLESRERMHFRPLKRRALPQVALRLLLEAHRNGTMLDCLGLAGVPRPADYVQPVTKIIARLLNARILLAWVRGTREDAFDAFCTRNGRAYSSLLPKAQMDLCLLSLLVPEVTETLDALLADMEDRGLRKVFTVTAVNELVQRCLPPMSRRMNAFHAVPGDVAGAVVTADRGARLFANYVRELGIAEESLIVMPSAWQVACHLFVRFEVAAREDFARRWLAQAIAQGLFVSRGNAAVAAMARLSATDVYRDARTVLSELVEPHQVTEWASELLEEVSGHQAAAGVLLYVMAQAQGTQGVVSDFAHPDRVFPAEALRMVELWPGQGHSPANQILASSDTAAVIERCGGWGWQALEELACGQEALATQFVPLPSRAAPNTPSASLIKERAGKLSPFLSRYLATTA